MATESVYIGGISHETNTFASTGTQREDFQKHTEVFGDEILENLQGSDSEIGGIIEVYDDVDEYEVTPGIFARAVPGSTVEQETYSNYKSEMLDRLSENLDEVAGVLLVLHGAMVTEEHDDGEGDLLTSVREIVGESIPIVATLDLHANVSPNMVDAADALVSYETYPHTDTKETGENAAEILRHLMDEGVETEHTIERPPLIAYPPKQNTDDEVMGSVMRRARELEEQSGVLKVSINAGFMQADVPFMGFSVVTVSEAGTDVGDETRNLAQYIWDQRFDFVESYPTPDQAVADAIQFVKKGRSPVVLADTGDNPGSGGAADGTTVLRAMLNAEDTHDQVRMGVAILRDPDVVEAAIQAGVGETITVDLGGKTDDLHGDTINELDVYVKSLTDGQYRNRGPMETGLEVNLGRTALLKCGSNPSTDVIVTENRVQPYDREAWRHVGVQPSDLDIIAVKSKNHFRADYDGMAEEIIPLDTPGAGAIDPVHFEFSNIRRPKFPMDDDEMIEY